MFRQAVTSTCHRSVDEEGKKIEKSLKANISALKPIQWSRPWGRGMECSVKKEVLFLLLCLIWRKRQAENGARYRRYGLQGHTK
jgi:hypothetical protein